MSHFDIVFVGIWSFLVGMIFGGILPPTDGSLLCRLIGHRYSGQLDPRYLRNLPEGFMSMQACQRCGYTKTQVMSPEPKVSQ